ncbi:hypothetical protein [Zymomonas mobilis]|nr:hypothetical protein [Zymomonas mobilis]
MVRLDKMDTATNLLRELALGHNPPSRIEQRTFLEVVHLRGDLGRLGGL